MQKHVNLVDLVKSFPTNIFLQNLASIQKRTSPVKFAHLAEKSGKGSISNLSTKVCEPRGRCRAVTRFPPPDLHPRQLAPSRQRGLRPGDLECETPHCRHLPGARVRQCRPYGLDRGSCEIVFLGRHFGRLTRRRLHPCEDLARVDVVVVESVASASAGLASAHAHGVAADRDFQKEVPAVPQFSDNMHAQRRAGAAKLAS